MSAKEVMSAKEDDEFPRDMDAFRLKLARRLNVIISNQQQYWRNCPEKACRRARACRPPRIACSNSPPAPEMTEEQRAQLMATIRRALEAESARRELAK